MLNGVTEIHLMKADVLDEFDEIRVCTHYELPNGEQTDHLPDHGDLEKLTPVYISMPGWRTNLQALTDPQTLPVELKSYVSFLEEHLEVPISIVSVGPDRVSTLHMN